MLASASQTGFVTILHRCDMASRVLVPFDGSECAERGLERAIADHPDAAITVLSVVEPLSKDGAALSDAPLDTGTEVSADGGDWAVERFARERDCDLRTVVAVGTPAATIVEYADEHAFEAIVMGTHGRSGLSRLLFGSVAETVARHTSAAVTLIAEESL